MKFGGTSVATTDGRRALADRVTSALELGVAPVVVVSAMGRAGAAYATDTLLGLIEGLPTDERERDLLATTGELIACVVVAHELRAGGVDAMAFSGAEAGILTDGVQGEATIISVLPARLLEAVRGGRVPVVAGFQGVSEDGRLTALGRGGSDTTACAFGVALDAEGVEIYTDVDGVMSADPQSMRWRLRDRDDRRGRTLPHGARGLEGRPHAGSRARVVERALALGEEHLQQPRGNEGGRSERLSAEFASRPR